MRATEGSKGDMHKETGWGNRRVADGARQGDGQILHRTLSARQPVGGVTMTKCMFLFPPENSTGIR